MLFNIQRVVQAGDPVAFVGSGVVFGKLDTPIVFEARVAGFEDAYRIEILVAKNDEKGAFRLEIAPGAGSVRVYFFNPSRSGLSGALRPVPLVMSGDKLLSVIFHTQMLNTAETFQLTYEFSEGPPTPQVAGAVT